jgi:hypothetical protein
VDVSVKKCLSTESGVEDLAGIGSSHGRDGVVLFNEDGTRHLDHSRLARRAGAGKQNSWPLRKASKHQATAYVLPGGSDCAD